MDQDNLESQIPLILYRLDTTAQVLEEIKAVLDKQTQNLTSLLVLQEKHSNLQAFVAEAKIAHDKEMRDLTAELTDTKKEVEKLNGFVEKFNGGLYVGIFLFAIFQGVVVWWVNGNDSQLKSAKDQIDNVSNKVTVLETKTK